MPDPFETLIGAAIRAPSGDNTQPWCFVIDDVAAAIKVAVDPTRDLSPMNAGQRMSRVAAGAAVENIQYAAKHNGWQATLNQRAEDPSGIILQVEGIEKAPGKVPSGLVQRVTNRRLYKGTVIAPAELSILEQASETWSGVRAIWISDREKLGSWSRLIGYADALMFAMRPVRKAFVENIRFDRAPGEEVDEGLSLGSLELSFSERLGVGLLGSIPDSLFRLTGMGRTLQKKATELVQSASGLCILVCSQTDIASDFLVGQLMQRIWLQLTDLGLSVQPMMSLSVLNNLLGQEESQRDFQLSPKIGSHVDACLSELAADQGARIAAILRFGKSSLPTGRTGRRPAGSVTRWEPGSLVAPQKRSFPSRPL
jgi:nitroreductase